MQSNKAALHVIKLLAILEVHSEVPPAIRRPAQPIGQLEVFRRHIIQNGLSDYFWRFRAAFGFPLTVVFETAGTVLGFPKIASRSFR